MICQPCREAGDWNSSGHEETAAELHTKCYGKNVCDCQHYTGKLIQAKSSNGRIPNKSVTIDNDSSGSQLE